MKIKHKKELRLAEVVRGVTPRRLAAARRALQNQQDKFPLLAVLIAEAQPTPEQRILNSDQKFICTFLEDRKRTAKGWREARKQLRALIEQDRNQLLTHWNRSHYPKTPVYLKTLIHRWLDGWRPQILTDADLLKFAEGRKNVNELLEKWRKEKNHVKKNS
jgi:ribosome modulation factor